jgi:proteasome accessory factor B
VVADLLDGKVLDRDAVARKAGVQGPAADRLIRAILQELPVEEQSVRGRRRVKLKAGTRSKPPSTTTAVAACLGASLAPLLAGSAYQHGIVEAARYLAQATNRPTQLDHLERKFFFVDRGGDAALTESAAVLDEIVDALLDCRHIRFTYTDFEGRSARETVTPLSLVIYDHQLYLLARGTAMNRLRAYRLARIAKPTRSATRFEYPSKAEFDPKRVFRDSFGVFMRGDEVPEDVVVRLAPRWRVYARSHHWHPTQEIDVAADAITIRLRVRICPEVEGWLMSFGDEAEVIAPDSLRRRIASRLAAAALKYPSD